MPRFDWGSLTRTEVGQHLADGAVVALAVGALEQHGDHLPTDTDNFLVSAFLDEAAERASVDVLVLPPLPFGFSPYHQRFGGTVSLSSAGFLTILSDICASVRTAGATTLVLVNGHGGNAAPLKIVSHENSDHDFSVIALSYWDVVPREAKDLFVQDGGDIGHAGQAETSLSLALRAPLVGTLPDLSEPVRPQIRPPTVEQLGDSGVIGDPYAATAELGAHFAEAVIGGLVSLIEERALLNATLR